MHAKSGSSEEANTSDDISISFFIDKITLKEGEVVFADRSLEIPFKSTAHAIKGSIMDVGSQGNIKSVLNLEGTIDKYALAKISGTLLSAQPKAFTRMDLEHEQSFFVFRSFYWLHAQKGKTRGRPKLQDR
jgi:hypothetical protein